MSYSTFFYDRQIRRFLTQFIRALSNFQVQLSNDAEGNAVYQRVPVFYADANRQASQILRQNSENTIKAVPAMAVHINKLTYDRERVQEPNFVSKMNIRTRAYDENTGEYTDQQGGTYTVERLMPVPYRLTLKVDVWTSNTEQKLQLLEQIMILFNPAMEIQSTDNYIDWTSLSYVLLTDIDWSNRTVPTGTEETIDIASLTFELPIWISAPTKVKQLGVIYKIISSVIDVTDLANNIFDPTNTVTPKGGTGSTAGTGGLNDVLASVYLTFDNYDVVYQGNTLRLLKKNDLLATETKITDEIALRTSHSWQALVTQYGTIRNGISRLRLMQPNGSEVIGTIALHPSDDSLLLYTPDVDTIPANTLPPVNAIINPQNINVDSNLLAPATGTRYLLLHAVGHPNNVEFAPAWNPPNQPQLIANANDIVEFNGLYWTVTFDSQDSKRVEYITNMNTGAQYRWSNNVWAKSIEGRYNNSLWSLTL